MTEYSNATLYETMVYGPYGECYIYSIFNEKFDTSSERFGINIVLMVDGVTYQNKSGLLFGEYERAYDFLNFLKKHLVTPSNLPYIIEGLLDFASVG